LEGKQARAVDGLITWGVKGLREFAVGGSDDVKGRKSKKGKKSETSVAVIYLIEKKRVGKGGEGFVF